MNVVSRGEEDRIVVGELVAIYLQMKGRLQERELELVSERLNLSGACVFRLGM